MTRISYNMKQTQLSAVLSTEPRDQGSENNASALFQFKPYKKNIAQEICIVCFSGEALLGNLSL